jgi:hypothetical protein
MLQVMEFILNFFFFWFLATNYRREKLYYNFREENEVALNLPERKGLED